MALPRPQRRGRFRRGRILLGIVLLTVLAVGVVAVRLAARPASSAAVQPQNVHLVPVPTSPAIDQAWGIRFTALILGADRGILDVRYVVVNPAKSSRIHGGSVANPDPNAALKSLPRFIKEGSGGGVIMPSSAMMHFEHFHFQTETIGSGFSILYGNSGGLLHVGDKVTIHMSDGLEIKHVVISS